MLQPRAEAEKLFDGGQKVTLVLAGQRWFGAGRIERELVREEASRRHLAFAQRFVVTDARFTHSWERCFVEWMDATEGSLPPALTE